MRNHSVLAIAYGVRKIVMRNHNNAGEAYQEHVADIVCAAHFLACLSKARSQRSHPPANGPETPPATWWMSMWPWAIHT